MNNLSPYASKIVMTTALASLIIGFLIGVALFVPIMRGADSQHSFEQSRSNEEILSLYEVNTYLTDQVTELKTLIADLMKRESLISTFLEAGYTANTPSEIRTLLDEARNLPFGSPFKNGHRVTAQFGKYTIDQFGWTGVTHPGIDLLPKDGDFTVYSPVDGTVVNFGYSEIWGKNLTIQTDAGYQIYMAHLNTIYFQKVDDYGNWSLDIGDRVTVGTRLAIAGQTGRYATGPHLHYEIRTQLNDEWVVMDPEDIIDFTGGTE